MIKFFIGLFVGSGIGAICMGLLVTNGVSE